MMMISRGAMRAVGEFMSPMLFPDRSQRQPDQLGGEAEPRGSGAGETTEHALSPEQHR